VFLTARAWPCIRVESFLKSLAWDRILSSLFVLYMSSKLDDAALIRSANSMDLSLIYCIWVIVSRCFFWKSSANFFAFFAKS